MKTIKSWWLVSVLALLMAAGCARLPTGVGIAESERESVVASFQEWRETGRTCPCCFDAAATVTFKSWIQSGTLSGFVQAMEPAFLKFVALNPFGQPMLMLASDGRSFELVSVPETKVYAGSVRARAFEKYAPDGAKPEHAFFWLTARLPPEGYRLLGVARDEEAAGYWLDLAGEEPGWRHRILFDPRQGVLSRHLVLDDDNHALVDVRYDRFVSAGGDSAASCRWPGRLVVETREHRGRLIITMEDWLAAPLEPGDFRLEFPAGYERISVQ